MVVKKETQETILDILNYQQLTILSLSFSVSSKEQGFKTTWDNIPEKLMLVVTELSEALEAHRNNDKENFSEELADVIIRTLDICGNLKIDIQTAIVDKMKKNFNRPYKHNKRY